MTAIQILMALAQAIGFGCIAWVLTDWLMTRGDRAALRWMREGMVFEDSDGTRWRVVKISRTFKVVVVVLDSLMFRGERSKASDGVDPLVCNPAFMAQKELVK